MNKLQKKLLSMLKELTNILEKSKIKYTAVGGTAIGAIRHKGFIPWDDDIDLGIHEDDHDRFILAIEKSRFSFRTDIDKQKTMFFKVYDPKVEIYERGQKSSLFIDVFVLYKKRKLQNKIIKKNNFLQIQADSKYLTLKRIRHTEKFIPAIFSKLYGIMLFWKSNEKIQLKQKKNITESKVISNETFFFEGVSGHKRRIDNISYHKFEDTKIYVSDSYAIDSFDEHGDIHIVPKIKDRATHGIELKK